MKRTKKLPPNNYSGINQRPKGHYIGFNKYETPELTRSKYQIDSDWSDAKVRYTVDAQNIKNDCIVPYSSNINNPMKKNKLEFITRDHPMDKTGDDLAGGEKQVITFKDAVVTKIEAYDDMAKKWIEIPFE